MLFSAYRDLVQTIVLLFDNGVEEFLMSWNRRIAESALFFDYMADAGNYLLKAVHVLPVKCVHNLIYAAGFRVVHHGKCLYSFYRDLCSPESTIIPK